MMGVGAKRALDLYRSCAPRQRIDGYQGLSEVLEHVEVATRSDTLMTEWRVPFFFHEPRDTSAALRWLDFSMRMIDELGDGPGAGLRVRLYFWTRRDCKTALQY